MSIEFLQNRIVELEKENQYLENQVEKLLIENKEYKATNKSQSNRLDLNRIEIEVLYSRISELETLLECTKTRLKYL